MWKNPVTATPSIVQVDFGPYGSDMPGDGEVYCGPTSLLMGLYWLSANGLTQLAPPTYGGQTDPDAINLEKVVAGLIATSIESGTSGGIEAGMADYLSACGVGPSLYSFASTPRPDLAWLAGRLAPNVAQSPSDIAVVIFSVGWFYQQSQSSAELLNDGGHVLAPLTADLAAFSLTLNNSYPKSFENVPNIPAQNPQTVNIAQMPPGLTLQGMNPPESENYAEVATDILGFYPDYAVLWGGDAWTISPQAFPGALGYQPQTWTIDAPKTIDCNGGNLTVIAPLEGTGGFFKTGEGALLLTAANALSGVTAVLGGALASSQISGAPFGTGILRLQGGAMLRLSPADGATLDVAIAAGRGSVLALGGGGGTLAIDAPGLVKIGGQTDGETPNILRWSQGSLALAPGGGLAQLGAKALVLVEGSGGNLPAQSDALVAPYIVGQDDDDAQCGKFLAYDVSAGFILAPTTLSTSVAIDAAPPSSIYQLVDAQTVAPGAVAQVATLDIDGGAAGLAVEGAGATLQVGGQQFGDYAGVILNNGTIATQALVFGSAEGVIYVNDVGGAISAQIAGSSGLTMFGSGALTLSGDNGASLAGPIGVNSGTLVAANTQSSATGSGPLAVQAGATLEAMGLVAGAVTVEQSGVLYLNGGVTEGDIVIAAVGQTSSEPGGILQGGGTIAGGAAIQGVIRSGPKAGILTFRQPVTIGDEACFYWRLQDYVDDQASQPGVGWNALQFEANSTAGVTPGLPFYLDFSALTEGGPDDGATFWNSARSWTAFIFETSYNCWIQYTNFDYARGSFTVASPASTLNLIWTPAPTPRSLAERRRARALAWGGIGFSG